MSTRAPLALAVLVVSLLSSCSLLPCVERTHASGLRIVCDQRAPDMPESLRAAGTFAWELAMEHPDAFGLPWADPETGAVEMRVTGQDAEPFIQRWLAGAATMGSGEKALPIPRPEVPLRRLTTDRSVRRLTDLQHDVITARDLPDSDLIYQDGPDFRRNAVVVTIDHESDALLRALADRYGPAWIVIHIARRPPTMPL